MGNQGSPRSTAQHASLELRRVVRFEFEYNSAQCYVQCTLAKRTPSIARRKRDEIQIDRLQDVWED